MIEVTKSGELNHFRHGDEGQNWHLISSWWGCRLTPAWLTVYNTMQASSCLLQAQTVHVYVSGLLQDLSPIFCLLPLLSLSHLFVKKTENSKLDKWKKVCLSSWGTKETLPRHSIFFLEWPLCWGVSGEGSGRGARPWKFMQRWKCLKDCVVPPSPPCPHVSLWVMSDCLELVRKR